MSELTSAHTREAHALADAFAPDRALAPIRGAMRAAGVVGMPFVGAEELTRFMLICLVFVTFPYVIASGANIRMEELSQYLPHALQRVLTILIAATGAIVLAVAAASVAVATFRNLNNATPTLGIPYWVFFSAAFLGFLAAALECTLQLWKAICGYALYVSFKDEAPPGELAALEAALVAPSRQSLGGSPHA
jgi:TRAP-type C4-dicarboxylate transport system permease small subunit